MQILQHKYGNDGYAVWFKLLEVLGNSDGQYYDCTDPLNWEYLLSTFAVDNFLAIEIMDTLARIDAIDPELWAEKIIWVEKFVENLKQVYTKREVETPTKPSFRSGNHTSSGVSAPETPQSKVKESKVKENKEEENIRSEQKVPSTNTQFEKFNLWLKKEAPNVLKIKNQITEAQFDKLKQTYNSKQIMDIVLNLDNFKDAPKKYTNVNRTVTNWLQRENNKTK